MTAKKAPKKTSKKPKAKSKPKPKSKAKPKSKSGRGPGRPPSRNPKVTISFRVPEEAEEAFALLAERDSKKLPPGMPNIKVSSLYNAALAEYLKKRGVSIDAEVWA
jgi:hypothetical protein